jgi:tRNA pseudouridine55 synthase
LRSSGFLLIDKPSGLTSHDVVAQVRKALGTKKVGHAGTLDPMATGLLVLGFNQGTKLLTFAVGKDKTYFATIRLGSSTITDDAEGEVIYVSEKDQLAGLPKAKIEAEISKLTGQISQVPSSVSAIKVSGVRAYDLVRSGEQVELKPRSVTVAKFELLDIAEAETHIDLAVRVDCSSGTYIRALARDLGSALGVGGHLTSLRRTRVGDFEVNQGYSLAELQEGKANSIALNQACLSLMPIREIDSEQKVMIRQGKQIPGQIAGEVGAVHEGQLVAILTQAKKDSLRSLVVFEESEIA